MPERTAAPLSYTALAGAFELPKPAHAVTHAGFQNGILANSLIQRCLDVCSPAVKQPIRRVNCLLLALVYKKLPSKFPKNIPIDRT